MTKKTKAYHEGHVDGFAKGVREGKKKAALSLAAHNTINLLRDKILAMTLERKEVGEACNRMENSWKAYAYENGRIHAALEKLCEHRHGKAMHSPDWLCDVIDAALMEIWGNTVGPENKPLLSGRALPSADEIRTEVAPPMESTRVLKEGNPACLPSASDSAKSQEK